jgi:RNA polymerase sigma-70 factor (ECF subfamily)
MAFGNRDTVDLPVRDSAARIRVARIREFNRERVAWLEEAQRGRAQQANAADAAQEAFLDAFRGLAGFDASRPFYAWLYVLLRNRCFKQRARRGTRSESGVLPDLAGAPDVSPERMDLWRAIDRLSPEDAELIVLKHNEGWTYVELSAARNVPRGTVMSRLYAARQRLQAGLGGGAS